MREGLFVGSVHIDFFADVDEQSTIPSGIDYPGRFYVHIGGTAYNIASNLHFHGKKVYLLSGSKRFSLFTEIIKYYLKNIKLPFHLILVNTIYDSGFLAIRKQKDLFLAITSSVVGFDLPEIASIFKKKQRSYSFALLDCNLSCYNMNQILKITKIPCYISVSSKIKTLKLLKIKKQNLNKIKGVFLNMAEFNLLKDSDILKNNILWFVTNKNHSIKVFFKGKIILESKVPQMDYKKTLSFSGAGDAFASGVLSAIEYEGLSLDKSIQIGIDFAVKKIESSFSAHITNLVDISTVVEDILKDPLTKVYTRKYFEDVKHTLPITAVALADIDNFKKINDTYGHKKGDEILHKVAHQLILNLRSSDMVFRYGGEEFLIIFTDNVNQAQVAKILERVRVSIKNNTETTISIGFSMKDRSSSIEDLIHFADLALYKAKRTGKNKVVLYEKEVLNVETKELFNS